MGKQGFVMLLLGLALGANFVLVLWMFQDQSQPRIAAGQTVDSGNGYILATGQLQGKGNADGLFLWNAEKKKLLVYFVQGDTLKLMHVRDCSLEMAESEIGDQIPTRAELKRRLKKKKKKN